MSETIPNERAIYKPSPALDPTQPFANDALDRKKLADQLTEYVDTLRDGCVIGISADWGNGKSWFGNNWRAQLDKNKSHKTLHIDAFENDFNEDAFLVIAAEILRGMAKDKTLAAKFLTASASIGASLLPTTAKILVGAASNWILGMTPDEVKETLEPAADGGADATEKFIAAKLKSHEKSRSSVTHFKTALAAYCAKQSKPVVFFIDELDRCRPTFAVQMIERIKHFFEVPNLVFVLLLNRTQLEASIRGVYGESIQANGYLLIRPDEV